MFSQLHYKFSAVSRSLGLGRGGGGGVNISAFELPSLLGQRASSDLASSEPAGIFFHPHFNCQVKVGVGERKCIFTCICLLHLLFKKNPLYANARNRSEHLGKCFRAWKGVADNDMGAAHPCRDRELAKSCCTLSKLLNKVKETFLYALLLGHILAAPSSCRLAWARS